ncbi:Protein FAM210B, mitochondrial [Channa argus]|uniref:Protein FAM210B, mitochondrial n=1 Tax=Channa argus TaxID=215402 RepID=A0A6G1PJB2_CHAAH|nr:Protein FAM210B, mitochondrial [Channa argus]
MLLCRAGRLSAAALDQAFKSSGSFLGQANKQTDLTVTLRKGHTVQSHWCLCASTPVHRGEQPRDPHPVQNWDSSSGFVIPKWATVADNLSKSAQTEGGHLDTIGLLLVRAKGRYSCWGEPVGNVMFTGCWGLSSLSTRTMHTRASSTQKSVERTSDGNIEEKQNVKEASTTPSSTEKLPGEPEPEGGKPNKTQQLKKVFKEYGAVGVSFHIGISLISLGMFYLLVSSGIDMAAVLCKLGFSEAVIHSKMAAGTSTFVLAYAIHKLFAPVRISITLVSVPLIVRHFRKTGVFLPRSG